MKKTLTICILLLFISCTKNIDPFSDVEYGKITKKEFIKLMKSEKVLIQDEKDTTHLRYLLNVSGKEFPIIIYINEERWLRNYDFGYLRKIEFNIGTDTKENDFVCRGCGPISKEDVDIIYNYYIEQYGKPDSLIEKYKYTYSKDVLKRLKEGRNNKPSVLDKTVPKSKRAVWIKDNFKLSIDIPHPTKNEINGGGFYYNVPYSREGDVSIKYEMKNYKEEFEKILDSIRISLKPDDILSINVQNPTWTNLNSNQSRLEFEFGPIKRKDSEEPKRVKGFKYDIVIADSFNEELYRFENITFDINNSQSYLESRPSKGSIGQVMYIETNMISYLNYNNFSEQGRKLQNIRNYMNSNKLKIRADVKKILYEDNSILQ